jgi:hydroxyethylthiazole kinase
MDIQIDSLVQTLIRLRQDQPVVHVINNWITAGDVAHALHAIGARPVMAIAPEEVEDIVSKADALVLNLGTPDPLRVKAMFLAAHCANSLGRPVIFDPVGVGASRFRTDAARNILSELRITVIRGNRAEIGTLAEMGGKLRGIDADQGPADLLGSAKFLSQKTGAVVVLSGPRDLVVGSEETVIVENGHPMMGRVTGTGCMLSAIFGAFTAVVKDPMMAAAAATTFFGLAGERAASLAKVPGTFKTALLDALFTLTPEDIKTGAKISFSLPPFSGRG